MSLTSESMTPADIAAVTGNSRGSGGGLGYGDGAWWIIILFLFAAMNGWGNNGNGGGNGGGGNYGAGDLYPWMNQSDQINDGFRDQMLNTNVMSIRDGIQNLSTQLCNCCGDMQMALANGFAGVEQGANARQMADMQQAFAMQQAMNSGFNGLQSQLAQCCCDNRLATVQTQNIVQNEGAQTRLAIQNQTQSILDKLCQLELDGLKQDNANLRTQLNMANLAASQIAQTAQIREGQNATMASLVNELTSCPIPSQPVYGSQPIFTCNGNNNGCGCGCGCGA